MAEPKNPFFPFADFDFSKFDVSQFDYNKMFGGLKMPGVGMEAMMNNQRKNMEALTAANQKFVQGMQAVARRQTEILAQAMADMSAAAQQIASAGDPQRMTAKQAELTRQSYEKTLVSMRELAEMINQANTEAFEVINQRISEVMNELQSQAERPAQTGKGQTKK